MKILPIVNEIRNDVSSSGIRLKIATADGYRIADRTAKIYKQNKLLKYCNVTRSVSDKVINNTTRKDLPYIAGAIGMVIPIPLMSPLLMGLGFLARYSAQGASMLYENQDKANHLDII